MSSAYCFPGVWNGNIEDLPCSVKKRPFWQYGIGSHSRLSRAIVGSVVLNAKNDDGEITYTRNLVIQGSSQWVIYGNETQICNIIRLGRNALELLNGCGTSSLQNCDLHCAYLMQYF